MRSRTLLSDEELALWAHVVASVKPFQGRKLPKIAASNAPKVETHVLQVLGESISARPIPERIKPLVPLERRMRQRVTRGQSPIDGVLDLHGMRQDEAHRALLSFIYRKHHDGAAVVIIITGKGGAAGASERGVLRRMVPHWLSDPGQRRYVLGFEDAAQRHGGTGALYVRLRRMRESG